MGEPAQSTNLTAKKSTGYIGVDDISISSCLFTLSSTFAAVENNGGIHGDFYAVDNGEGNLAEPDEIYLTFLITFFAPDCDRLRPSNPVWNSITKFPIPEGNLLIKQEMSHAYPLHN